MNALVAIQRWLYSGMASGLGDVAGGDARAIVAAMAAAVLFGAVHALMPGHGKTVLVSYHLGQPAKLREGIVNGAILALTHVGLALVLVLAGFAVISKAFAYGGRTPQFETASGVLVALIGAFLLWRSMERPPRARTQRRQDARLRDRNDPLPANDLHHELCDRARDARCWTGRDGGHDARHDRHHRRDRARCRLRARPFHGAARPNRELAASRGTACWKWASSVMVLVFGLWMMFRSLPA